MSTLKVEKVSIVEKKPLKSSKLDELVAMMKANGYSEGYELLPKKPGYDVDFELHNTYSGFANAIRRVIIEEIPVFCLNTDESKLRTDDEFISGTSDVLLKNINLTPIMQNVDIDDYQSKCIYLLKTNRTTEIIDIMAKDLIIGNRTAVKHKSMEKLQKDLGDPNLKKSKKGGADDSDEVKSEYPGKESNSSNAENIRKSVRYTMTTDDHSNVNRGSFRITEAILSRSYAEEEENMSVIPIEKLIPNNNIILVRLRPGKTIYIEDIGFEVGVGINSLSKFSLVENIRYEPIDMTPYDIFTGTGTRSIEYDPKKFRLGFTILGHTNPKDVINKTVESLNENLTNMRDKILKYSTEDKKYYNVDGLEVTVAEEIYIYKFSKQYFTCVNMIAQRCFLLDENILFCTTGVERYDTRVGIIKLKHADCNKLLLKSIDACLADLKILNKSF
jgi:hypothetical protein